MSASTSAEVGFAPWAVRVTVPSNLADGVHTLATSTCVVKPFLKPDRTEVTPELGSFEPNFQEKPREVVRQRRPDGERALPIPQRDRRGMQCLPAELAAAPLAKRVEIPPSPAPIEPIAQQ